MRICLRVRLTLLAAVLGLVISTPIAATASPSQQDSRLQYNESRQSELSETRSEENWEFSGSGGDLILIDMRADGSNLDTYLTLLDPFGSPLVTDDDSGEGLNSRVGPFRLPSSGIYTIVAGRYGGAGGYLLQLMNLSTIPTLSERKPLTGIVNSSHPTDYFLLPAGAPDTLWQITVIDDQLRTDPYLALYGASGLISSTEPTSGSSIDPVVPLPDDPYILVVSWNTTSSGGPYQIELKPSETELLEADAPQTAALGYLTMERRHYFRGNEGEPVRLVVEADGNIALAFEVTTLDGSKVLFSGTGETSREVAVTLALPQTAVYVVNVWDGSFAGDNGSYLISLER